ncbi:hypothetical protein [Microbacterium testaceum]|uniref:hypothetical protein n=1 Tax=Microbacterium testaceum TaxID=2033 RepID=UPI003825D9B0
MVISIEDRPHAADEMLWVRQAYGLDVEGDVPPLLTDTPAPAARELTEAERARWAAVWPSLWMSVIQHAGRPTDHAAMERLMDRDLPTEQRKTLLSQVMGPSWRSEFGEDVFEDPSYREWQERSFRAARSAARKPLDEQPERRDLDALVPAWRRGLERIVVLACRDPYARTVGPSALLVTAEVREESRAYRAALASFAPK